VSSIVERFDVLYIMRRLISRSVAITSSNIGLVFVLSAVSVYLVERSFVFFLLVLFSSSIFMPAIYGRFAELSTVSTVTPWGELFKKNCLNYWAVALLLGAPVFFLITLIPKTPVSRYILFPVIHGLLLVLNIYIYPYIFLRHLGLEAIVLGWNFLIKNLKQGSALIVIMLFVGIVETLSKAWLTTHLQTNLPLLVGAAYAQNTLSFFVQLLVFNVACMMVNDERLFPP
jgi:hypothetical protein